MSFSWIDGTGAYSLAAPLGEIVFVGAVLRWAFLSTEALLSIRVLARGGRLMLLVPSSTASSSSRLAALTRGGPGGSSTTGMPMVRRRWMGLMLEADVDAVAMDAADSTDGLLCATTIPCIFSVGADLSSLPLLAFASSMIMASCGLNQSARSARSGKNSESSTILWSVRPAKTNSLGVWFPIGGGRSLLLAAAAAVMVSEAMAWVFFFEKREL
mmetsp:Transcript_30487/g.56314  ORF Transcript_30487/g.56314 Transcript_30487/m.56314 type:complete len:214 (-) Transcript_30487:16-657(-)